MKFHLECCIVKGSVILLVNTIMQIAIPLVMRLNLQGKSRLKEFSLKNERKQKPY